MEGTEERDPGYDDWFDEPELPTEGTGRHGRGGYDESVEDVWVLPEERRPRRGGGRRDIVFAGRTLSVTQVAIVGASALAIFLAILAAAGVFSGGKTAAPPVTTPPTTASRSTSTPTKTTPTAQAPTQSLTPGDTGAQVKLLQRALAVLGYSPGKADGDYGPATVTALKQFQASKGLTQDGIFGPQTATALQQALSG